MCHIFDGVTAILCGLFRHNCLFWAMAQATFFSQCTAKSYLNILTRNQMKSSAWRCAAFLHWRSKVISMPNPPLLSKITLDWRMLVDNTVDAFMTLFELPHHMQCFTQSTARSLQDVTGVCFN